ncbi:putative endopeptidase [Candidatus Planktophila dulcis]|uniref:Endopeptidase n=1 Tax=Candidatus Planktophila dulcis TaxID=1884914 RepID=A0AAC9YSI5_9ACTN|nr:M13-type metalloendopeptidase [Candidatus Planktophila dulcis]ASY11716.1 putative endopeptidase [Candidatus Planktophila dulcis]ASY14304.1 putative endopeptidase [Candidatus Planktophila dulcis]
MSLTSGIDSASLDPLVRPQDDLFRHYNGKWVREYEMPADRSSDGIFRKLHDEAEEQVRQIIETSSGVGEAQKIGDLYKSFMDTDAIKARGISPIVDDLAAIDGITNLKEFITVMARLEMRGIGGIFGAAIYPDAMDSNTNILYIGQGGLSLPDESYYREEQFASIRTAFLDHVAKMCALVGIANGADVAKKILTLETEIATHHWDQVKDRDATLTYNKYSRAELEILAPHFLFDTWASNAKVPAKAFESLVVCEPSFFESLSAMFARFDSNRDSWVAWLKLNLVSASAAFLTDEIVQQNFEFYAKTLSGTPQIRDRWKRGVSVTQGALGEAIGKVYVEKHFPARAKQEMKVLVDYLLEAYRLSILELPWMSDATKQKALEKLKKFTPKIGYPDKWRDYSTLEISADDLIGNLWRIAEFDHAYAIAKIGAPVDRDEWHMTPQTVNAYYNPLANEIVFPAAILQPPFFDLDAEMAANYGGIGATIGHEIGHGFDDQGSKYDGDGNMVDWWLDEDRAKFEELTSVLVAQFDALSPESTPDIHVNGAFTLGENIGDLGGLAIAYKAYKLALKGAQSPVIDGFTGDQRFFLSYAHSWRNKNRPEEVRRRIAIDPHSPDEFRCNQIVRNVQEFYDAFALTEKDQLWLAPKERVRIW